jgi:hypothetical protein
MDVRNIGSGSVEWIQMAQDRVMAGSCKYDDEPVGSSFTELVRYFMLERAVVLLGG